MYAANGETDLGQLDRKPITRLSYFSCVPEFIPRRNILNRVGAVATAGVIAGCSEETNSEETPAEETPTEETETPSTDDSPECDDLGEGDEADNEPGDGFPSISVESDAPELDGVQIATRIVRHFDEAGPARLRVDFLNDGGQTKMFSFGPFQPFTGLIAESEEQDDEFLALIPESSGGWTYDGEIPSEPVDGCWVLQDDENVLVDDLPSEVELDACETISMEYDVYDLGPNPAMADGDECLAEGVYRFTDSDVGEMGHEWSFSLFVAYH